MLIPGETSNKELDSRKLRCGLSIMHVVRSASYWMTRQEVSNLIQNPSFLEILEYLLSSAQTKLCSSRDFVEDAQGSLSNCFTTELWIALDTARVALGLVHGLLAVRMSEITDLWCQSLEESWIQNARLPTIKWLTLHKIDYQVAHVTEVTR